MKLRTLMREKPWIAACVVAFAHFVFSFTGYWLVTYGFDIPVASKLELLSEPVFYAALGFFIILNSPGLFIAYLVSPVWWPPSPYHPIIFIGLSSIFWGILIYGADRLRHFLLKKA